MNKTTVILSAVIVLLVLAFAWYVAEHPAVAPANTNNPTPAAANPSSLPGLRTLSADLPAAGLDEVELEVGVGEVHVTAAGDDQVHVQLTLQQKQREFLWFFHWATGGNAKDIAAANLVQHTEGKRLQLALDYPHSGNPDDIRQEWEVQLPARLKLVSDMKVGEQTIEGVAGGVDATLNVGELSIDAPRGALHAKVNVGEIRAKSASPAHGRISLSSNIGEAQLYVDGKQSGDHRHSGGIGNEVSLDGDGPDDMRIDINVGEAALHLNPQESGPR